MKRIALLGSLCLLALGCGGDGDDGGNAVDAAPLACPNSQNPANPGFICPTEVATAYDFQGGAWVEIGPADFSCLNAPSEDTATTVDINLTGEVRDFQMRNIVPDATVELFPGVDFDTVLDSAVSDVDGIYAMTVPSGQVRVGFKIVATDYLDTFLLNQYLDPAAADQTLHQDGVSVSTANLLPAIIGISRTPGLGVLAAAIRDCAGNEIANVIATVSGTSGSHDHLPGAQTYYFSGGASPLPTNLTVQQQTNTDGLFVVLELPEAASAYLQVWGFTPGQDPTRDELTLLAEIPSPVIGDSVITASLEPLRN